MKEKKSRVDDALHTTRVAVVERSVAGGGVTFVWAITVIDAMQGDDHVQDVGIAIARRALEEPLRQIVANDGDSPSVVVAKVYVRLKAILATMRRPVNTVIWPPWAYWI